MFVCRFNKTKEMFKQTSNTPSKHGQATWGSLVFDLNIRYVVCLIRSSLLVSTLSD